jgi:2-methylcitrate dehydratase PrpD
MAEADGGDTEASHTQALAEFVVGIELDDVPPAVLDRLTGALVDAVGCALYGSTLPWSRTLLSAVQGFAGPGPAVVVGTDVRVAPDAAALVNGAFVHSFEYDDLHMEAFVHPGSSIVPALLAHVDHSPEPVSGAEFLAAVVAGYEAEVRVGLCAGLGLLRGGWHNSAVVGPLGASAAMARVLRLTPDQANECFGTAATQAGGLVSAQYGAMVKRFHPGRAAQSGYYAGMLVAAGYTGIRDVFDQELGGFPATLTDDYDLSELDSALGEEWRSDTVGFKMFPASASTYTTIEACLWASQEAGVKAADVERVRVRSSSATLEHVGWPYRPDSVTTAQMNLRYCGAIALLDGDLDPARFSVERLADAEAVAMTDRFEVEADRAIDAGGRVRRHAIHIELDLFDGTTLTRDLERGMGFGGREVTQDDLRTKFLRNAAPVLGEHNQSVHDLLAGVRDVEDMRDVTAVLAATNKSD